MEIYFVLFYVYSIYHLPLEQKPNTQEVAEIPYLLESAMMRSRLGFSLVLLSLPLLSIASISFYSNLVIMRHLNICFHDLLHAKTAIQCHCGSRLVRYIAEERRSSRRICHQLLYCYLLSLLNPNITCHLIRFAVTPRVNELQ